MQNVYTILKTVKKCSAQDVCPFFIKKTDIRVQKLRMKKTGIYWQCPFVIVMLLIWKECWLVKAPWPDNLVCQDNQSTITWMWKHILPVRQTTGSHRTASFETLFSHWAERHRANLSGFYLANSNRRVTPDICLMCFCYVDSGFTNVTVAVLVGVWLRGLGGVCVCGGAGSQPEGGWGCNLCILYSNPLGDGGVVWWT